MIPCLVIASLTLSAPPCSVVGMRYVRACACGKRHKRYGRCRKSRPLCRAQRARVKGYYCSCDGYHYRHRRGGGFCEHSATSAERRNRLMYGAA